MIPDDPLIDSYGQDAGYCEQCNEHLDSGRCDCLRCEDCSELLDEQMATAVTVKHVVTGEPVEIQVCDGCAIKRERDNRTILEFYPREKQPPTVEEMIEFGEKYDNYD